MGGIRPILVALAFASTAILGGITPSVALAADAQITFTGTVEDGAGRVQIEVQDAAVATDLGGTPDRGRFRAVVTNGDARVASASRVAESGERVYTVLAFDRSGSFKRHWDEAFEHAEVMAAALPASGQHTVEVMAFHGQQWWHGTASTPSELKAILREVKAQGPLGSRSETSLMSAIREGSKRAAENQPENGARQLIMFTDAGEEGTVFEPEETVKFLRDQGVPFHPIILKPGVSVRSLDNMKKIAADSGGFYHHGPSEADMAAVMRGYATVAERLFWVELSFCGVHPPPGLIRFDDTVQIEVRGATGRQAFTDAVPFSQHAFGTALVACGEPPSDDDASDDDDSSEPEGSGLADLWPWLLGLGALALLGLLLLLLLLLFLRRGKRDEEPDPTPSRPTPPKKTMLETPPPVVPAGAGLGAGGQVGGGPPPPADDLNLNSGWINPLKERPLPDTRLYVEKGPTSLPQYLFVNKKPFVLGALVGEADHVIDLATISGKHASILLYPLGDVFVVDHSQNGTFVDGQRIPKEKRVKVSPGQVIGLARVVELRLEQPGAKDGKAPPAGAGAPRGQAHAAPSPPAGSPPAGGAPQPPPGPAPGPRPKSKTVYDPVGGASPTPGPAPAAPHGGAPAKGRPKSKTIYQPVKKDGDDG